MKKRIIFLSVLILLSFFQTFGQVGREFWFVAPDVTSGHGDSPVLFRFTTFDQKANVRISMPANADFTPISLEVDANTQEFREINKTIIENRPSDKVNNKGILITSDVDITVYYEVANSVNPDKFTLKGENGLGTEFYIPSQHLYRNQPLSPIADEKADIVATEDNTIVTITPSVAVTGHNANDTYSIVLNKGQTYSIEYKETGYNQCLAGTYINSTKAIAITISDDSINEPGVGPYDLIGDQLVPTSVIGTEYIAVKPYGQKEGYRDRWGRWKYVTPVNKLFILAVEDDTYLTINNDPARMVHLNKGELIDLDITDNAIHVSSNKPVYAYQLASFPNGNGNEIGSAILPPITCTGSKRVSFTRTFDQRFYIQLLTQGRNRNHFVLRDQNNQEMNDLDAITWEVVPGTNTGNADDTWYSATMPLTISTGVPYSLENTNGLFHMGILDENQGSTSYGYFSSYGSLNVEGLTRACVGDAILLETVEPMKVYRWYSEFSGGSVLSTDPSITVKESGKYWVTAEVEFGGCEQTDTVEVEFIRPEFDLGPDQELCPGEEAEIVLPNGLGTYTWYDGSSNIINRLEVHPGDDIDVWVEVKDDSEYSCVYRDSLNIKALELPPIDIPAEYQEVCLGDTIWNQTTLDKYEWKVNGVKLNDGDTLQYIIASVTGTYELTGWSDEGCSSTQQIDVIVHALPQIALKDTTGCYGLPCTFHGPAGMDEYQWTVEAATFTEPAIELTAPHTFKLQVKDANGCRNEKEIDFTWHNQTAFEITSTITEVCENNTLTVQSTSGMTNYAWTLKRGDGTQSVLSVAAPGNDYSSMSVVPGVDDGWYVVKATDANSCEVADSVEISVFDTPDIVFSGDTEICEGEETEMMAATGFSNYHWSSPDHPSFTESGLIAELSEAGQYVVHATSPNGCPATGAFDIVVHPLPVFDIPDFAECHTNSQTFTYNGSASIESFLWSDGSTGSSLTLSNPETVWLEVTEQNTGCKYRDEVVYSWYKSSLFDVTNDDAICSGESIDIIADPNFKDYRWQFDNGTSVVALAGSDDNNVHTVGNASPSDAGKYIVSARDKVHGCAVSDYMNLTVPANLPVNLPANGGYCENTTLEIQGYHAFTEFEWFKDGVSISTQPSITITAPGTYTLQAALDQTPKCPSTGSVVISNVHPLPDVSIPQTNMCPGENVAITFNSSNPINDVIWSFEGNELDASQYNADHTLTVAETGTYDLIATDVNGCVGGASVSVGEHVLPNMTLPEQQSYCEGSTFDLLRPSDLDEAQVDQYEWRWLDNSGATLQNNSDRDWMGIPGPGRYALYVKDVNACENMASTIVVEDAVEVPILSPDQNICLGETATLNCSSQFVSYEWRDDNGNIVANTNAFETALPGVYHFKGLLANTCESTSSVQVNQLALPSVDLPVDYSFCADDTSCLKPLNGLVYSSYEWRNDNGAIISTNDSLLVVQPGTYAVQVADVNGCKNSAQVAVTHFPSYPVNLGDNVAVCGNESFVLSCPAVNPNPFATYSWYKVNQTGNAELLAKDSPCEVNEEATYQIRVTDINGCQSEDEIEVDVLEVPEFELGADQFICAGDTVRLMSDNVFEHYQWKQNGNITTNNPELVVTDNGQYELTVWNKDGCSFSDHVHVTANPLPDFNLAPVEPKCAGIKDTLRAPLGYSRLEWSTGEVTPEIIVDAGTYEVTVFDEHGCSASDEITFNWLPIPEVNLGDDEYICPVVVDTLYAVSDNDIVSYSWHDESTKQWIIADFADTVNIVTVKDVNGCQGWDSKLVKALPQPEYDLGPDAMICAPDSVLLDAGDGYSEYIWSDSDRTQTKYAKHSGIYWVDVFDQCHWMRDTVEVTVHESPVVTRLDTMIYGQIVVYPDGGTEPYQYALNGNSPQDENVFKGLSNGDYLVEVIDANGCLAEAEASLFAIVDLDVPDILTPNDDGFNDTWEISGLERFPDSMIRIYDRFGKLLVEYPASDPGWDGRYLNKPVPSDAYWYVIEIIPLNKVLKGHITLKR